MNRIDPQGAEGSARLRINAKPGTVVPLPALISLNNRVPSDSL